MKALVTFINQRPLLRASLTSATVMSSGDIICQLIQKRDDPALAGKRLLERVDLQRTARFGTIGALLHGPWFLYGFRWLDSLSLGGAKGLKAAVMKTTVGQLTMFPSYLSLFSMSMGLMEGRGLEGSLDKTKSFVWPTFVIGCAVWPPANVFNFMFVPPQGRVLYVNMVGILWNAILSYANTRHGDAAVVALPAVAVAEEAKGIKGQQAL